MIKNCETCADDDVEICKWCTDFSKWHSPKPDEHPCPCKQDEKSGLCDQQEHYLNSAMQPIQVMQAVLSREAFIGYLYGNVIKYSMRAGHKEGTDDKEKARQYMYWISVVRDGRTINPATDAAPPNFLRYGLDLL